MTSEKDSQTDQAASDRDESSQETLTLKGHTGPVTSVAFSPDGRRIVSGGRVFNKPGELKVWDAHGQETLKAIVALGHQIEHAEEKQQEP